MVEGLLEAIRIAEFPLKVERQRAERLEAAAAREPKGSESRADLERQAADVRRLMVPLESVVRLLRLHFAHAALHHPELPDAELRAIMAFVREHAQFDRFDEPTRPNATAVPDRSADEGP